MSPVSRSVTAAPPASHPLRTITRVAWLLLGALFKGIARLLSIILSSLEVILGVALLLRWYLRPTLWILLVLLVFFTFLTFYSAAFNKVTDCGCFGDFIKLTPWTSFAKDLFLLGLWAAVFFNQRFLRHAFVQGTPGIMTMTFASAISIGIGVRALGHLPYFDFLPYKVGNDIGKLMKPSAPLRYKYVMEKNGKTEDFTAYPDSTWTYRSMVTLNPQDGPKITDFRVWNDAGDYTPELLRGNKLVLAQFNAGGADSIADLNALKSPRDGWLMRQGMTLAWWGWEMDGTPGLDRVLMPPVVARNADGSPVTGIVRAELLTPTPVKTIGFAQSGQVQVYKPDSYVGYPAASLDNRGAALTVLRAWPPV